MPVYVCLCILFGPAFQSWGLFSGPVQLTVLLFVFALLSLSRFNVVSIAFFFHDYVDGSRMFA